MRPLTWVGSRSSKGYRMEVVVSEEPITTLEEYASIPISFQVRLVIEALLKKSISCESDLRANARCCIPCRLFEQSLLGRRLRECTRLVTLVEGRSAEEIF